MLCLNPPIIRAHEIYAPVLNAAYALATACVKEYQSKFSRKDFTGPQLFACLVLREHQKKSYRGLVALLKDCPHWCADIGLKKVPDHNTLCRAHQRIGGIQHRRVNFVSANYGRAETEQFLLQLTCKNIFAHLGIPLDYDYRYPFHQRCANDGPMGIAWQRCC